MSEEQKNSVMQPGASANPLPELSAEDFEVFNYCAAKMEGLHSAFRETWATLYDACAAHELPKDVSVEQFIEMGMDFCKNLTIHHDIEEKVVFPFLGQRMPAFNVENSDLEILAQHRQIHGGLEKMGEYLSASKGGKREFGLKDLKTIMDGFREILWVHMDDEVNQFGPDKMRAYWSVEEIKAMPFYEPVEEDLIAQVRGTPE
ncbi:hypothetical protein GX51_00954 [Blastomyces parvus]|uniref:Hemerythrin-like domain-containing protein n=1 Tax=Blastomyces parvus TaxID=2060905 RepID=A0A2B7XJW7_9EURO|nr:hypothetical protein GX51_00954 [Blastomyces parvus]